MRRKYRRLASLAIGLYCAGTTWSVLAAPNQSAPDSVYRDKQMDEAQLITQDAPPSTDAAAPSNDQATELQAVTVTGSSISQYQVPETTTALGTETSVLNTPFSVTPIPKKVLRDQAAQSLEDAVRNAPGVSVNLGEGNRDELIIRGVKTKSDFFMDGMRDDSEYFRPLYNVDHIDVLKGPAALQFGRAGAGGIVNFVTKKAEPRHIRNLMIEGGSWSHLRSTADFGTPIGDFGAFRLMGMIERSHSFRDHGFIHREAINPKFHFDLDSRTRMDLSFSYLNDRRLADRGIPSQNGHPVKVKRSQLFGSVDQNRAHSRVIIGDFNIEHEVNDHLKLRNQFRASQNTRAYRNIYPATSVRDNGEFLFKGYNHPSKRLTYQDRLEAISDFDTGIFSHKVLGGVEYTWQRDHDIEFLPGKSKAIKGVHTLGDTEVAPVAMTTLARDNVGYGREIGVFLQDQVSLGEHWIVLGGIRYDRFSVDVTYHKQDASAHRVDNTWSPRAALMYKPVKNDTMYFSFSRTYTPSGANIALSLKGPGSGANLKPEKADQYEIGNKLGLFDGNLILGIAFFQIDLTNIAAESPEGGSEKLAIGKQRNRGIELSANGSITNKWRVFSNYTYMDATNRVAVKDTPAGAYVGLVPHNQFSIWSTYDLNEHWGVGAGIHGESRKYTSFTNEVILPAYAVGDLMAYFQEKNLRLQINLNNITDETYYPTASGDNQIMPGIPRSVIASANVNF